MLPFTPGAVDEHRAQRDPVDVEVGKALAPPRASSGRRHRSGAGASVLGQDVARRRPGLGADRGQEDEALDAARSAARARSIVALRVDGAVIVLRQARHGMGEAGRMDDRVDIAQGRRHVPRRGDVADDRAGRRRAAPRPGGAGGRGRGSRASAARRRRWRPMKPVAPVRAISGALIGAPPADAVAAARKSAQDEADEQRCRRQARRPATAGRRPQRASAPRAPRGRG